ncbi:DUF262 domain-containing protein [Nostoc sp. 'Peltigera membranacea cyanobiont' 232]|uniref:DUF262 domain-containing protein n=1 Tax=Nostoc sp. 'Peltigera membranacea cyanobiont' 232 TaxID=2014531 RepID=UPI000B9592D9|nr:DUF262 domain-containing protein [Nostoc sp. 'Peltigera membranacea cyanobiont' 232]OYE00173.1 hypothetical protein CDG79_36660 [Nostoc sp. 'Peltigera membranacea cyanobiont' 232]
MMTDDEINAKYESAQDRLIQEIDRIKLPALVEKIRSNPNYMVIDNESQSALDWDDVKKSKLIESFIINLPVMPIVLYEKSYHTYEVLDGKQRLKAILYFYTNQLVLSGLEVKTELNGCTYTTLPYHAKTVLNRHSLSLISIIPSEDANPEEIAKLIEVVAERLN